MTVTNSLIGWSACILLVALFSLQSGAAESDFQEGFDDELESCSQKDASFFKGSGFASLIEQPAPVLYPNDVVSRFQLVEPRQGEQFRYRTGSKQPIRFHATFTQPAADVPQFAWMILSVPRPLTDSTRKAEKSWDAIIDAGSGAVLERPGLSSLDQLSKSFKEARGRSSIRDKNNRELATFNTGSLGDSYQSVRNDWTNMLGKWAVGSVIGKYKERQTIAHTTEKVPVVYQHTAIFLPLYDKPAGKSYRFVGEIASLMGENKHAYGFAFTPQLGCVGGSKIKLEP